MTINTRVLTLLDPTKDPLGAGYHILQSMIAIGSGGVWGQRLAQWYANPFGLHT